MKEKKLIKVYTDALEAKIKKHTTLLKSINSFIEEFNKTGMKFKPEDLIEFMARGQAYIVDRLTIEINSQLKKMGVSLLAVRNAMLKDINRQCAPFIGIFLELENQFEKAAVNPDMIKIKDDEPYISQEYLSKLEESLKTYLETEFDFALYDHIQKVGKELHELSDFLKSQDKNQVIDKDNFRNSVTYLFEVNDGKLLPNTRLFEPMSPEWNMFLK